MEKERILLVYNLSEKEKEGLKEANYNIRIIDENNSGAKLSEIIEGKMIPHSGKDLQDIKVVIFSGFNIDDELKEITGYIRQNIIFGSIMAVTTETNLDWTFDYLMGHLLADRDENIVIEKERRREQKERELKNE